MVIVLARDLPTTYVGKDRDNVSTKEGNRIILDWHNSRKAESRGRWMARSIPKFPTRTGAQHGKCDTNTAFSDHGYFDQYMCKWVRWRVHTVLLLVCH